MADRTRAESAPKRNVISGRGDRGKPHNAWVFQVCNFFLDGWAWASGAEPVFLNIVLPLGISFFTFQKIALITDAYLGKVERLNALDYMLFVMFFPQLIAGPIVHHSEVMPQFAARRCVEMSDVALGLTIFVGGLAKKVLFADGAAQFATPVFDAAAAGTAPTFFQAWLGALAYTVQLYFDFSGYSDMAIGAALLFGIRLPINFASPYKATSIIDFWRRWHMTLSRFLRDYLYVPLGGNRRGPARRYMNLGITMVLGGLWHGAGWTFVLWGAMHAGYLGVNHAWRALARRRAFAHRMTPLGNLAGGGMTFLAVVAAWVVFRAADVPTAGLLLRAMAGFGGALCQSHKDRSPCRSLSFS